VKVLLRARVSYLLLLPSFALVILFYYYPALSGIYHAFTTWQAVDDSRWVGLDNFIFMASDRFILHSLLNQFLLTLADMAKALIPPFIVAEMIFALRSESERYWLRTLCVVPMVAPAMVIILMWYFIYDPNVGLLNQSLVGMGLEDLKKAWLGDPDFALGAIVAIGFPWIGALAFLILYAGLNGISGEIIDAARIDGVSTITRILHIDIPMLIPQFRVVIILTLIGSIQDFGRVLVMTGGGPGFSTYVPALWMYEQTFLMSHFGYASAIGVTLFLIILISSTLVLRLMKSDVEL
jgi:ABC-type sugar transport system permease subunit